MERVENDRKRRSIIYSLRSVFAGYRLFAADRHGWVAWTWSKVGALIVFTGLMAVFLSTFFYLNAIGGSESANALARDIGGYIMDAYSSRITISMERQLPNSVDGRPYSISFVDTKGLVGVLVEVSGANIRGGASLPIAYAKLKAERYRNSGNICVLKSNDILHIHWSRCE